MIVVHENPELYNDSRGLEASFHSHSDTVPFPQTLVLSVKSPAAGPGVYQPLLTTALFVALSLQPPLFPSMLKTTEPQYPPSEGHTEKFLICRLEDYKTRYHSDTHTETYGVYQKFNPELLELHHKAVK